MDDLFNFEGKVALVTGGSRGLGREMALALAKRGADVVITSRKAEACEEVAEEIKALGRKALAHRCHVAKWDEIEGLVEKAYGEFGKLDILINNAGMQHRQPLENFDPAAFDRVMATNVTAVFTLSQLVARHMIERKQGKIINIASVMTKAARHMIGAYTTSKAAVAGLTRAMTAEWAQHGIGCNAIGPGYFSTELTSALFNQEEFASWLRKRTPAGRWGEVDDLVGAALFLSAPASNYVNGHVLYVDGGMTATIG